MQVSEILADARDDAEDCATQQGWRIIPSAARDLRRRRDDCPYPLSIKGVLIHDGRVLLLLNERGEWDLPGGRPDPGEDHRAALAREVREETGLDVVVGALLDEHLFEVLPQRFVRIIAYACILVGTADITLSDEHLRTCWAPVTSWLR